MGQKFGEIVVEMGFLTQDQLDEVVELQQKGRTKIGKVMVNLRHLRHSQVDEVLDKMLDVEHLGKRFGECALALGFITEKQLIDAIRHQKSSKGVLGDLLIELGYLTEAHRDEVIREQLLG